MEVARNEAVKTNRAAEKYRPSFIRFAFLISKLIGLELSGLLIGNPLNPEQFVSDATGKNRCKYKKLFTTRSGGPAGTGSDGGCLTDFECSGKSGSGESGGRGKSRHGQRKRKRVLTGFLNLRRAEADPGAPGRCPRPRLNLIRSAVCPEPQRPRKRLVD
jgi:hypothetical protein